MSGKEVGINPILMHLCHPHADFLNSLAYLEMRLVLGKLIWNYDLEYEQGKKEWVPLQNKSNLAAWIVWHKPSLWARLTPVAR